MLFPSTGYGQAASSQYGQLGQGPIPYAGPGPGPGGAPGYSAYGQQVVGPRMPNQSTAYSMYGSQPHGGYPMQHTAAEQYPGAAAVAAAAATHQPTAMAGWQGERN